MSAKKYTKNRARAFLMLRGAMPVPEERPRHRWTTRPTNLSLADELDAGEDITREVLRQVGSWSDSARRELLAVLRESGTSGAVRARDVLTRRRPELVEILGDAYLASALDAMRRVARQTQDDDAGQLTTSPLEVDPVWGLDTWEARLPVIRDAVEDLRSRGLLTKVEFDALDAEAKQKAFTVAGVEEENALGSIRDALADTLEDGETFSDFDRRVEERLGSGTFLNPAHAETVFRTNMQSAYSKGQEKLLEDPAVGELFPYRAYDATHDDRVRDEHLALEALGIQGTNIYRADDPVWQLFQPPWAWGDRCSWRAVSIREAARLGIAEAIEWLRTGTPPARPTHVAMPPFRPDPEFSRELGTYIGEGLVIVSPDEWTLAAGDDSPWVQKQGKRGGQFWYNAQTGQKRYQKARPGGGRGRKKKEAPKAKAKAKPEAKKESKATVDSVHDHVNKLLEQGETGEDVKTKLAALVLSLTVKDAAELKKRQGVKASGNKAEAAKKIAERILEKIRDGKAEKPAKKNEAEEEEPTSRNPEIERRIAAYRAQLDAGAKELDYAAAVKEPEPQAQEEEGEERDELDELIARGEKTSERMREKLKGKPAPEEPEPEEIESKSTEEGIQTVNSILGEMEPYAPTSGKVFISDVWDEFQKQNPETSKKEFFNLLNEGRMNGSLKLARYDNSLPGISPEKQADSEMDIGLAKFHLLDLSTGKKGETSEEQPEATDKATPEQQDFTPMFEAMNDLPPKDREQALAQMSDEQRQAYDAWKGDDTAETPAQEPEPEQPQQPEQSQPSPKAEAKAKSSKAKSPRAKVAKKAKGKPDDARAGEALGQYKGIEADLDNLTYPQLEQKVQELGKQSKAVIAGVMDELGFPTGGSKTQMIRELTDNLRSIKGSREQLRSIPGGRSTVEPAKPITDKERESERTRLSKVVGANSQDPPNFRTASMDEITSADPAALGRDLVDAVNKHSASDTIPIQVGALYDQLSEAHPGLTPADFKLAIGALQKDGAIKTSQWSQGLYSLPRPEVTPVDSGLLRNYIKPGEAKAAPKAASEPPQLEPESLQPEPIQPSKPTPKPKARKTTAGSPKPSTSQSSSTTPSGRKAGTGNPMDDAEQQIKHDIPDTEAERYKAAAAAEPHQRDDLLLASFNDKMQFMKMFKEYRDGVVEIPHLYEQIRRDIPNLSPEEFNDMLIRQSNTRELELHTRNEVADIPERDEGKYPVYNRRERRHGDGSAMDDVNHLYYVMEKRQ